MRAAVTTSLRENFLVVLRDGARIGVPKRFLTEPFPGVATTTTPGECPDPSMPARLAGL